MQKALAARVDGLGFSTRVQNVLDGMQIETLAELVCLSDVDLLRSPNLGRKSLSEIHQVLNSQGLSLGMKLEVPGSVEAQEIDSAKALNQVICNSIAGRVKFLVQASLHGCTSADIHLGRMYLEGAGVATDFRKARVYFARAARKGSPLGYWNLAVIYSTGYGVRRSASKSGRYLSAYKRHHEFLQRNVA
jgi:hypothetical protein